MKLETPNLEFCSGDDRVHFLDPLLKTMDAFDWLLRPILVPPFNARTTAGKHSYTLDLELERTKAELNNDSKNRYRKA